MGRRSMGGLGALLAVMLLSGCQEAPQPSAEPVVVRLCAPQNANIEDFETNTYKLWLEEQTGLEIEMTWLPARDAEQLAHRALTTGENLPDAYIGFGSHSIFKQPSIQGFIDSGAIIPLDSYIESDGVHTKQIFELLDEFYVEELMKAPDGKTYFMPGFSYSNITRYSQIMWVNRGWMDTLGLDAPTTTEEFYHLLKAFKNDDPNGDGQRNEIPLAGTEDAYSKQVYNFLMNSFIYNDPKNSRLYVEDGTVLFAPTTDAWREGLTYMNRLCEEELLSPLSFTQDDQQMRQMANDPRDILGAFQVSGFTYTVDQASPEVIARYEPLAPLEGPAGVRLATLSFPLPKPNGVITKACDNPEAVFRLFDLMLSKEACLQQLGVEGEDWRPAEEGERSIFGHPAKYHIVRQLWKSNQNHHLMEIGPYVRWPEIGDYCTKDESDFDGEFINAQARQRYMPFEPADRVKSAILESFLDKEIYAIQEAIDAHTLNGLAKFITGEWDVHDDAVWASYTQKYDELGLDRLLEVAQKSYDRLSD